MISEGAEGIILESAPEGYAEYFSADLSEKAVRGMTENALKCVFNGGTIPMGRIIDREQHFQPDPLTAPMVPEAIKRYDEGATMKAVRDWLNNRGFGREKFGFGCIRCTIKTVQVARPGRFLFVRRTGQKGGLFVKCWKPAQAWGG